MADVNAGDPDLPRAGRRDDRGVADAAVVTLTTGGTGETNPAAGHRRTGAHHVAHVERSGADLQHGYVGVERAKGSYNKLGRF